MGSEDEKSMCIVPHQYLAETEPEQKQRRASISCARQRRRKQPPKPDNPRINITGRYKDAMAEYTFCVNQAGTHIECWMSRVYKPGEDAGIRKAPHRLPYKEFAQISGDLQKDGKFSMYTMGKKQEGTGCGRKIWQTVIIYIF